jgi:AcrR family transcriptional regulator
MNTARIPVPATGDVRIRRTVASIRRALLSLLDEGRALETLTVSELAARAGVTRKTFYARCGSIEGVVRGIVDELFAEIGAGIDDDLLRFPLADHALSRVVFAAYDARRSELAPLVRHCPAALIVEPAGAAVGDLLDRALVVNDAPVPDPAHRAYLLGVLASVAHGVLSVWVERDFAEAPETVADLVDTLLATGLERLLLGTDATG